MSLSGECIEWPRARTGAGYGQKYWGGKVWLTHRLVWTLAYGDIPDGICVCHKCDNPACYRLGHLFLGTHADNMRDKDAKGRNGHSKKTHCKWGHPFTAENTYRRGNERHCRTCHRIRNEKYEAKKRAVNEA